MIGALKGFWRKRSLRERITAATTLLFAFAVVTGAVLLIGLQRWSLTRSIDSSAYKTGNEIAALVRSGKQPSPLVGGAGDYIQIVDAQNRVEAFQLGTDAAVSLLSDGQVAAVRAGGRLTINAESRGVNDTLRVVGVPADDETVIVATSMAQVTRSVHLLRNAALLGIPIAVLAMALVTYWIVGQTIRPVRGLRAKAEAITAAGLADQRLPVPAAEDEIQRLAVTLNAMLDRLDSATSRQRTFVGDAAHELRSPIASARLQLEIAQRLGPETDWNEVAADVMVDIDRLQRLVDDLLALARSDEAGGGLARREPVDVGELVESLLPQYSQARVPVEVVIAPEDRGPTVSDAGSGGARAFGPLTVSGDPDGLRRIVVNLVDNALRYAAASVCVTISSEGGGRRNVVIAVSDDGPGIEPNERGRVFDRFYRIAASRSRGTGGTGLGLPIVRDLVRAHGGSIVLSDTPRSAGKPSEKGGRGGLTATVTLPARSV
ncbi:signal transduction histidine kinase [Jatrophihabitans sp. GAS493]|uniref:ATP-binding protein n=1 Tax=Jatrophihabitans sp. GAS493 TaxID=1907575 RepID=UPI000BB77757|nr:ATP-binding protein [Jatrophihabitans sp. GAS493]SOD70827.1 signal transduction histidine kinase [Jatrophihabitans sp. GAS493]